MADIVKNTPLKNENRIRIIIDAAKKVTNLYKYEQILEQVPNASRQIKDDVEILKNAKNVTLK